MQFQGVEGQVQVHVHLSGRYVPQGVESLLSSCSSPFFLVPRISQAKSIPSSP